MVKIAVLGAGVIGCTTAVELKQQLRNADVTIIADKFNADTLSDGAAGIFRPGTSFLVQNEEITRTVIKDSFDFYWDIKQQYDPSSTGVLDISGYIFSSTSASLVENPLIDKLVPVYRRATEAELQLCPGGWQYGTYFSTLLTECRRFLPWSLERFRLDGGHIAEMRVSNLKELYGEFDLVVNCTGLGAKQLCQDRQLVPVRGQVLKVTAPWLKHFFYADYDTYIIPGQDATTLGGCRQLDSHSVATCRHDTAAILERCCALLPRLREAPVQRVWAGLRPHRWSVRIEAELLGGATPLKVVHHYGHGGYGVTTAPGSAKQAVKQVLDLLRANSRL